MRQIFFAIFYCTASLLYGAIEIMPLKDVKPGMRGKGLTVFENNQIEQFDVEVIDIVRNFFPQRDLILVRLLGDRVNHTGIVSGMSGSPIYIDDKLIGALAYRLGIFLKDPIAGVTPIEQMLEIFTKEEVRAQEITAAVHRMPVFIRDYFYTYHFKKFDLLNLLNSQLIPDFQEIKPIETPLIMTGFVPAVYNKINSQFNKYNFTVLPGGKIHHSEKQEKVELEPGSSVAGIVINGDYNISAFGTVTYREGNKILAFGHPLFNSGPVNIPMAQSKVITTLSSLLVSNKFAVATNLIGNIRQDRVTGIMAVIGDIPPMIPIKVAVNSPIIKEKRFNFKMVNDRSNYNTVPVFLWITLLNALETARLGSGDYALNLNGRIELKNAADVILDNFYSGASAGFFDGSGLDRSEAALDVVMTLATLLLNSFEPPVIQGIELEFYARPGHFLAEIENVLFDKEIINPGDTLNIVIYLRPYQGKKIELKKQIFIPQNLSNNSITVAIGGRNEITEWEYQAGIGKFIPTNFSELVALLNRKRKNTNIIVQLKIKDSGAILHGREFPTLPPSVYNILADNKTDKIYKSIKQKVIKEWLIPTEYEIRGGRKFNLKINHH